jgi:hypothetical protein
LASDNNAAQTLIADQSKVCGIDQRSSYDAVASWRSVAIRAMTSRTEGGECLLALHGITGCVTGVGGRNPACERVWASPVTLYTFGKNRNLPIGQHRACSLTEWRHGRAGDAICGDALDICNSCEGEIYGVRERDSGSVPAIYPMTRGAILAI